MKPAPTLIDALYRASFRNELVNGWTSNHTWRTALTNARRFVLDDNMSTFLGELGTQAFARPLSASRRNRMAESLRVSARLPHATTWIEYNLRNCQTRSHQLISEGFQKEKMYHYGGFDANQIPRREGWLLQQHPGLPTATIAHIITHDPTLRDENGDDMWTFPVALAWTSDDQTVLPWRPLPIGDTSSSLSEVATGLVGYKNDRASYVYSPLVNTPNSPKGIAGLIEEWAGVLRRMWAFLATIADLPMVVTEVRAAKGFMGRRQYRRFLDHKVLTLNVPAKDYRKTARNVLALAHRRGGPVRQHWRRDWRTPLSPLCEHQFTSADETHITCTRCLGRKILIPEHVRGDSSRGFSTHDYVVTHEPPA